VIVMGGKRYADTDTGPGQCVLAAQRAGQGSLLLGDTWLKNVLVVFDIGAN
jgi:hypothetical protein